MRIRHAPVLSLWAVALAASVTALIGGIEAAPRELERAANRDAQARAGTDFLVSKGLSGPNHFPAAAVNSTNGDILVIWRLSAGSSTSLRGRLYRRQPDGSHSPRPIFEVSGSATSNNSPDVHWVDWLSRYVVLWDTFGGGALVPTTIEAAEITAAGRVAKRRTIIGESKARTNLFPRLGVSPERQQLLLTYTALPNNPGDKKTGVVFTLLNDKLKARGKKFYQLPPPVFPGRAAAGSHSSKPEMDASNLGFVPIAPQNVKEPGFGFGGRLQTENFFDDDANPDTPPTGSPFTRKQFTWVYAEDGTRFKITRQDQGAEPGGVLVPAPTDPAAPAFGETRQSMFVTGNFDATFDADVYGGDLDGYLLIGSLGNDAVDGAYLPRNYHDNSPQYNQDLPLLRDRASRADFQFAHLVVLNGKFVQQQALVWTGPAGARTLGVGKAIKKLFNTKNKLAWMATASDPGQGVKVVVWTKTKGATASEVRVHIYE